MIEGIYDSWRGEVPGRFLSSAESRFRAAKNAGLDVVMNYATGGMEVNEAISYADLAVAQGMRVIWNPWTGPASWRDLWIDAVARHPGTWGYYVGDEAQPGSAEATQVRGLAQRLRGLGKPTLYVSRPGRAALRPFLSSATHVGPDCYPIGSPPWWAKPEPQKIGDVAQWSRAMVDEPGGAKKLAFVCQCFAWGALIGEAHEGDPVLWPTADQMQAMRRAVIRRGHPDLLMWFAMHAVTDTHPDPARYWNEFAQVIP